jgi:hypothetical protein
VSLPTYRIYRTVAERAQYLIMDPLTFATSGIALATVCLSIVSALRTIIETHKNCPEELKSLLQRADGLSFLLGRLDAVKHKLLAGDTAYIQRAFDEEACRKTVREMNDLVWKICGPEAGKQTGFLMTIRLIVKNSDVHLLLKRLSDHQHDIAAAIGIIDVYVLFISFMIIATTILCSRDTDLDTKANTEAILRHMAHLKKDLASLGASVESLKTALTVGQSLDALQLASKPVSAFPANLNIPLPAYIPNRQQTPRSSIQFGTWHGATRQFGKETQYTRKRSELSDAAYCYAESNLHAVLNYARTEYNQNWVNSIRLGMLPSILRQT